MRLPLNKLFTPILLIIIILAVFVPALRAGFVYWDDDTHLFQNPLVISTGFPDVKKIFTPNPPTGYIPLVTFSFALERYLFGMDPFHFHLVNILLHTIVTLLIFYLAKRLGLNLLASFIAALIFGIHPLHVEPVAWVTARKDTLYSLFYLLALHSYWGYLNHGKKKFFWLTILLGSISSLAKPMALSLPIVLFLFDWKKRRNISLNLITEKLPHFLYWLPIAWITYLSNKQAPVEHSWIEAILILIWTLTFYIKKFVFPSELVALYDLPNPITVTNPEIFTAIIIFCSAITLLFIWRNALFHWAIAFYILSLFFLLKFQAHDLVVVADRYMYLPSIGFCFLFGFYADCWITRSQSSGDSKSSWLAIPVLILIGTILASASWRQANVWKDDLMLWDHTIKHNPDIFLAYNSRGAAHFRRVDMEKALVDFNEAIRLNPRYANAYYNRGRLYLAAKNFDQAINDFTQAIIYHPEFAKAYNERGLCFVEKGMYPQALEDYQNALKSDPQLYSVYNNRGIVFKKLAQYPEAIEDFSRALAGNPQLYQAHINRGNVYTTLGDNRRAEEDYAAAEKLRVKINIKQ